MNLTGKQIFGIIVLVLGVLTAATAQLQDVFGPTAAKTITSVTGLLSTILGAVLTNLTSQSGSVQDVQAMPGVETILVNKKANQTLAALAVDPAMDKIEVKPGDDAKVAATAEGATS